MDKGVIIAIIVVFSICSFMWISVDYGYTEVVGVVVMTRYSSWPWPTTSITFVYHTPDGVILEYTTTKTVSGKLELELGNTYRVLVFKPWYWAYPKVIKIELLQNLG